MNEAPDTKSRLLDVAEDLFAGQGLDRVSVRDITEAAGVHVGSVNYHFGSKEAMIEAVFDRRLAPINQARIAALDAVEKNSGGKAPKIESILEAFIRPAAACCLDHGKAGDSFGKLFGRCMSETNPELESFLTRQFAPVVSRFEAAFLKACPELTRSEMFWKLKFTFGALHHWLVTRNKCKPDWVEPVEAEEQIKRLVKFTAAGFRA